MADITTDLVAHLKLNEILGTSAADSSPSGNDGTSLRDFSAITTAGISPALGPQVDFDNSAPDRITSDLTLTEFPWSINWYQHRDGGGSCAVSVCGGNDKLWLLYQTGETSLVAARRNTTYIGTTISDLPDLTEPRMMTVVYPSPTSLQLYVDAELKADLTGLASVPITDGVTTLIVGVDRPSSYASPSSHFNGRIDDVRVYSRGLTAGDVAALYALSVASNGAIKPRTRWRTSVTPSAIRTANYYPGWPFLL